MIELLALSTPQIYGHRQFKQEGVKEV